MELVVSNCVHVHKVSIICVEVDTVFLGFYLLYDVNEAKE